MRIGIINETGKRVALVPDTVKQFVKDNNVVVVESSAGKMANFSDEEYKEAGAEIKSQEEVLSTADLLVTINPISTKQLSKLKENAIFVSSFEPFNKPEVVAELSKFKITAFSLDMIPRITIAQSMDVLSSMASIAGYKAVILAANTLSRYFPMLTTAAGSIPPAKVLVLGAGVAGLQAIATAKRNGSQVEAFDTRAAAKEEVMSLGAKFVEVEGAQDDKDAGGYAVEQTDDYKQKQSDLIKDKVSKADVVISTAQLRGKKAPILITKEMVELMKSGSVVIDLASSTGGNCEVTEDEKTITHQDVIVIGSSDLADQVPMHASQLFAKNIYNFLKTFIQEGKSNIDLENAVQGPACLVFEGKDVTKK